MMKRFISSMLGSLAAIWISAILLIVLFFLFIGAIFSESFAKQLAASQIKDQTALYIDLSGDIEERQSNPGLIDQAIGMDSESHGLNQIVNALELAATDSRVKGVYINCNSCTAGLATLNSIRQSLLKFKKSGKFIIAYGDYMSQGDYYVASVADTIYLNPVGLIDIHGLAASTIYLKGLLDKVGIDMQVIKVGTFKSAVEPFLLTGPSEPSLLQQKQYLSAMWKEMALEISRARDIPVEQINLIADSLILTVAPQTYLDAHLIDKLAYRHEVEETLKYRIGQNSSEDLHLVSPEIFCLALDAPHSKENSNRIAVLYAYGDIVDNGKGGIVASEIVPEIQKITADDEIDGLILRVNSGGGSAFASEQIWEALQQFKDTGRPLYVSMGDYAASGGYYISCGADKIFADALTLTGSIGIFGVIPCTKDLLNNHLGVTTSTVSTNPQGELPGLTSPMTPYQRSHMQAAIDRGYETFVSRCAAGRNLTVDSIKAIAEGRVWDAITARNIGLIDAIGSLDDAIDEMVRSLNFRNDYMIVNYPKEDFIPFNSLLLNLQAKLQIPSIVKELGETALIFEIAKSLSELEPIQCRMENIIIK